MFLAEVEIDKTSLRQGDIVLSLPIPPKFKLDDMAEARDLNGESLGYQMLVRSTLKSAPAMILSHCCEIDRENNGKVQGLTLAPILRPKDGGARTPEKFLAALAGNDLHSGAPTASKFFAVEGSELFGFPEGGLVDFTRAFSVNVDWYEALLKKKVIQLNESTRRQLGLKVGHFFYRTDTNLAVPQGWTPAP